jgi:DNA-directed RNA polymerase subunit RPC12/RpoP
MAIKIIKEGVDKFRATCGNCGTTFSYEMEDVHTNYLKGGEQVSCPHCGHSHRHYGVSILA